MIRFTFTKSLSSYIVGRRLERSKSKYGKTGYNFCPVHYAKFYIHNLIQSLQQHYEEYHSIIPIFTDEELG